MLSIVGLGLHSERDITLRGLDVVKACDVVYLEYYTSKISTSVDKLESLFNKKVILADRELLEQGNEVIEMAVEKAVALLVIGTPFFATTHTDLLIRAKQLGVKVEVIHNASIFCVIGSIGLFSYSFGRVVSIPFFEENWKPTSFYEKIFLNYKENLHTLCLLDLRVREPKKEYRLKDSKEYDEPRYMSPNLALSQIMECRGKTGNHFIGPDSKVFVVSRMGSPSQNIVYRSISELMIMEFGEPLHSLIIPSKMEIIEKEHISELFSQ
jgi:diphthine synthase